MVPLTLTGGPIHLQGGGWMGHLHKPTQQFRLDTKRNIKVYN
jgi:hypothetical protein